MELYSAIWTVPDFNCSCPNGSTDFFKMMVFFQVILCCQPFNKQAPTKIFNLKIGGARKDRHTSPRNLVAVMYEILQAIH